MNWLERMIQFKDKSKKSAEEEDGSSDDDGGGGGGGDSVGTGLFTYPVLMAADILLYQADRVPVGEDQRQHLELARDVVRRFNGMYCKGGPFKKRCKKAGIPSRPTFTEPEALMAADILLYQADRVPVGEDQRQHLELARDVVRRFNGMYCKGGPFKKRCKKAGIPSRPTFTEPEAMIVKAGGARVMSLSDGTSKMSKSDPNDNSRINVLDPPDIIRAKIRRCKTDAEVGLTWDDPTRPEAINLLTIYQAVSPETRSREEILEEVGDMTWGQFKPLLADAVVAHLEPIQVRYKAIREDEGRLEEILRDGADAAEGVATRTLKAARVAMGFTPRG